MTSVTPDSFSSAPPEVSRLGPVAWMKKKPVQRLVQQHPDSHYRNGAGFRSLSLYHLGIYDRPVGGYSQQPGPVHDRHLPL